MNNIKNDNVVSTVVLSLESLTAYMQSKLPWVSFVYDENLGYDSGMSELRSSNNLRDQFVSRLPAFFFKRSVLRPSEKGQGRRSVTNRVLNPSQDNSSVDIYKMIQGTYDVEFNFVTSKLSEMENFEVSWLSEDGISEIKDVSVELTGLGSFPYFVTYGVLDDKIINSAENYYKVITGTINVTGSFLVFSENSTAIIKEINTRILTFSNVVMYC